jgi:hypothetical protein
MISLSVALTLAACTDSQTNAGVDNMVQRDSVTSATTQQPFHSSVQECIHSELKEYKSVNEYSTAVTMAFCLDKIRKQEIAMVLACNFNYQKAIDDGYPHEEIIKALKKSKPDCFPQ